MNFNFLRVLSFFFLLTPFLLYAQEEPHSEHQRPSEDPWAIFEPGEKQPQNIKDDCGALTLKINDSIVGCSIDEECISLPENRKLTATQFAAKYCNITQEEDLIAIGTTYTPKKLSEAGSAEIGFNKLKLDGMNLDLKFELTPDNSRD